MDGFRESFYFVRHAETDWNAKKLCQGTQDIPLNNQGRRETLRFVERLRNFPITSICSSPLKRALETAQLIHFQYPNSSFQIIDELKERCWGDLEGISSEEMYRIESEEKKNPLFNPGKNVEKHLDFLQRVATGLKKSFLHCEEPLIVSHGRWFLSLCDLLQLPPILQIRHLHLVKIKRIKSRWTQELINLR